MRSKPYISSETLSTRTSAWLDEIASFNKHALSLNQNACTLLVVDMQNFFLDPTSPAFVDAGLVIMQNIHRLISTFRKHGRPVMFTRHAHLADGSDAGIMGWWWRDMCTDGTHLAELHPELYPLDGERVLRKHRYSAFFETGLHSMLRASGTEDLVIVGVMTNLCCDSTARDAYYRDYRVFLPADASGTFNEEIHVGTLRNLAYGFASITRTNELIAQLERDDGCDIE